MKIISTEYLRKDTEFLEKLPVLIYAYIFCEGVRKKKLLRNLQSIFDTPKYSNSSFFKNAYQLSHKFFGDSHPFTLKIEVFQRKFFLQNERADILADIFPF